LRVAAIVRRGLASIALIGALLLALAGNGYAFDRAEPRIAHYISEDTGIGFVLDRSGELAKLKFDSSEEIFVLRWQPAAGGDRLLLRDDGVVVLRLSGLGGITLFTPANARGVPVAFDRQAGPLSPVPPSIQSVRDIAGQIMSRLRAEVGRDIVFEADWGRVAMVSKNGILIVEFANKLQEEGQGKLDAIRNAGTALYNVANTAAGRASLGRSVQRVRFVQGRAPGVYISADMVVVSYSVEQGLAGRPSSYAIERQLSQFMR